MLRANRGATATQWAEPCRFVGNRADGRLDPFQPAALVDVSILADRPGGLSSTAAGLFPVCHERAADDAVWGQVGRWDNDIHFKIAVIAVGVFAAVLAIWLV